MKVLEKLWTCVEGDSGDGGLREGAVWMLCISGVL